MKELSSRFFESYFSAFTNRTVYTELIPDEMISEQKNESGWIGWKLIKGILVEEDYNKVEQEFNIKLPKSFIEWHKEYFFLDADLSILRLPTSNPNSPLKEIKDNLNWFIAEQLIPQKLYPFASEGNDTGPLVFDGRIDVKDNDYPVRVYDHEFGGDLEGLSEVIFSSFDKLLECSIHFMSELKERKNFEIIPEFFEIDPKGAGTTGVDYWLSWTSMLRANFEEFGY